jgi:hypothetical protein
MYCPLSKNHTPLSCAVLDFRQWTVLCQQKVQQLTSHFGFIDRGSKMSARLFALPPILRITVAFASPGIRWGGHKMVVLPERRTPKGAEVKIAMLGWQAAGDAVE